MAILFTDGFDSYGTAANTTAATRWTTASGVFPTSADTPWNYGQSLNLELNDSATVGFTASSTFTVGAAIAITVPSSTASQPILALLSDSTWMIGLTVGITGGIQVYRMTGVNTGTVIVSESTNPGTIKSAGNQDYYKNWYYIELSVTISDTVGTVRVDVDGKTVINQSGLDTRNGTPTTVNTLRLGNNASPDNANGVYIDDLYISDSITPLGPQRIYTLRPNADTIEKDWVPSSGSQNFAMVDETILDADTTYVSASTVGDYDLYDIGDYPSATATIKAANHIVWARKTDANTRTITSAIKSGPTTSDSSAFTLTTSYLGFGVVYENDPNTSASWTVTDINNLQIGQKVAS